MSSGRARDARRARIDCQQMTRNTLRVACQLSIGRDHGFARRFQSIIEWGRRPPRGVEGGVARPGATKEPLVLIVGFAKKKIIFEAPSGYHKA